MSSTKKVISSFEKEFKTNLENFVGENKSNGISVTPGLQVQAYLKGQKVLDIEAGETFPYYDLASLTKVIFTTTQMMALYENNDKILEDKILKYLPWFFFPALSVRQLLTHTTGLIPWKPLYVHLDQAQSYDIKRDQLKNLLSQEKPENTFKSQYSDINYLLLSYILEEVCQKKIEDIWLQLKNDFNIEDIHFHKDNIPIKAKTLYAPTENCPWRARRLQGEVHDENAWSLNGISTHSGLFGNIESVSNWFLHLRSLFLEEEKSKFISSQTVQSFWQRAISKDHGDWALGFMMPSETNSTCGNLFSKKSVGHTGFTGTSVWFDPTKDFMIVILSNRVFYGRDNKQEFLKLRTFIHDSCYKAFVG